MTWDHIVGGLLGGLAVYCWLYLETASRRQKAQRFDASNPENQLRFVQKGEFRSRRPINKEAYRTVFTVAEAHLSTLSRRYRILSEVSMGSFLQTPRTNDPKKRADADRAFASINSKRVDFLIIDGFGMPVLVIEYHGTGHYQKNAEARDLVKQEALRKADIPLLVVMPDMDSGEIRHSITKILGGQIALQTW